MKILITGAGGLVGHALVEHCVANGDEVVAYDRASLDISDSDRVDELVLKAGPEAIINCAAWTDVDGCESDPVRSRAANEFGPENLAKASRRTRSLLITISTDYVFDGAKDGFYTQRDNPNPLSVYAHAKLAGERKAQFEHSRTIVVRSGFIFGTGGKNFLSTIVDRVLRGERPKVIYDVWGTPTSGKHLAVRLRELANLDLPGIYHVVSSGDGATYETFAREALRLAGCDDSVLEPVALASLKRPAPRPRNSKLKCLLSSAIGLEPLPSWREGMKDYFEPKARKHTEKRQSGA